MPERDGYLPGVPCWIDTNQPDPAAAAEFYRGLFGWELQDAMPPGSDGAYLIARVHGGDVAAVSSIPEGAPPQAMWNTYIWVDSADDAAAKASAAGGQVLNGPFDVENAGRMAVLADPAGAVFCVWQAKEHKGARVVNEPGSLVFNGLSTRDVDGAKRFYSAVFGWETLDLPGGKFWTLPGYGEYLEQLTPGIRKMTAEMGVGGFENVVAAIVPTPADQTDTPANWSVTFSTDDADATAAAAAKLGAKVVVAPFDAPFVRTAVLEDPQGATFAVSKFVPENKDLGR